MAGHVGLLLLLSCSFVFGKQTSAPIKLHDNGYEGLIISIHGSVDVSMAHKIINGTKEYFTAASRALFIATKRRAYFRKISILIPKEWIGVVTDSKQDPSANPELAHVFIAPPYDLFGNNPYVYQLGGCGEAGDFLHLTPEYITEQKIAFNYGHPGWTLVHEWGHLRWGLFDEYYINMYGPDNKYKNYYQQGNKYIPAKCSVGIQGSFRHRKTFAECSPDYVPDPECVFIPSFTDHNATASIMFHNNLNPDDFFSFCDNNPDDPSSLHNTEAPNEHNDKCQGRSAWEVMREHEDFKNGANPAMKDDYMPPDPVFSVVYPSRRRIVLVLDVSGSMDNVDGADGMSRIKKLHQAASIYISHTHPECQAVGVVEFSSGARQRHGIVNIDGKSQQDSLINSLPTRANGGTSIGSGLQLGLNLLKNSPGGANGGVLLVISDGEENENPRIPSVVSDIKNNKVIVDVILYSPKADNSLIKLADDTLGIIRYEYGSSKEDSLQLALLNMVNDRSSCTEASSHLLVQIPISVQYNNTQNIDIAVDEGLSSLTCNLAYSSTDISTLSLEVVPPAGEALTHPTGFKTYSNNPSTKVLTFAPADSQFQPGFWKIKVKNLDRNNLMGQMSCTSLQAEGGSTAQEYPIKIDTYVGVPNKRTSEVDFSQGDWHDKSLVIRVTLMKYMSPVLNATVKAIVNYNNVLHEIILQDSGTGADVNAGDGVYSAFFTQLPDNGKYSVNIQVSAVEGQAGILTVKHSGASPALNLAYLEGKEDLPERVVVPTSPFQRVDSGGFFNVVNLQPGKDYYPPSRITDLTVVNVSYSEKTVALEFTASGDDLDNGRAASYAIFYSEAPDFVNKSVLSEDYVIFGNISSPQPAGSIEQITVKLPEIGDDVKVVHFAIQVEDDSDQLSELSNMVSISTTEPRIKKEDEESSPMFLAPLLIVLFLIVIGFIVLAVVLLNRKKKQEKVPLSEMGLNSSYGNTESQGP